ncbi:MBL fold metallo-hydrolase [bacterium]|jgi:glyoxylase-like metal-dependent hydrolase (beta-lactamase superfamily II)|nr:MBL fold metallo-hydrolase [bacterium]
MEKTTDGSFEVITAGPASRFDNNIYIVIDRANGEAAFIDAPDEPEKCIAAAEAAGVNPSAILLTHGHMDHTAGIEALKARFGCKLYAGASETGLADGQTDQAVTNGSEVAVGTLTFRVLSVPGHTPGSTTYVYGKHAFVGDTLFPGGPGHSRTPEALKQEIESITTHLYALSDDTVIYPGHGAKCTIGESKAEYAVFAGKQHASDLHGDVNWLES